MSSTAPSPPVTREFRAPRLPDKTAAASTHAAPSAASAPAAAAAPAPASAASKPNAAAPPAAITPSASSGATVSQLRSNPFLAADRAAAASSSSSAGGSGAGSGSGVHHSHSSSRSLQSNPFVAADKKHAAGTPKAAAAAAPAPAPSASAPTRPPPAVAAVSLRSNPFLAADRNAGAAAAAVPPSPAASKPPAPSAVAPAAPKATASAPAVASNPVAVAAVAPVPAPSSSPVASASAPVPESSPSPTVVVTDSDPDVWAMSSLPVVTRSPSTGSRTCHACKEAIYDAQFVAAAERFFHTAHFSCSLCSAPLTANGFQSAADGDLLLCEACAGNCKSCFVCTKLVVAAKGQPQVVSLPKASPPGTVCHLGCFACATCARPLKGVAMFTAAASHQLYCEPCAQPFMPTGFDCVACGEQICGRVLLALENHWHPACFCCADPTCLAPLESVPFLVDEASNSVYCRPHFEALFSPKCSVCALPLSSAAASADGGTEGSAAAADSAAGVGVALANAPHIRMHAGCMRCTVCQVVLSPSSFQQDPDDLGSLYCAGHFEQSFAERCDVCTKPIAGGDATQTPLRVQDKIMHQACFACSECGRSLATCAYAEKEGKLVCEKHAALAAVADAVAAAANPAAVAAAAAPPAATVQPSPVAAATSAPASARAPAPTATSAAAVSAPASSPSAPVAASAAPVAAALSHRSTSSIQDRIRALQAQQQQSSASPAAASPVARGSLHQKAASTPTAAAAVPPAASAQAAPATSTAASTPARLAAVPESSPSVAPDPATAALPVVAALPAASTAPPAAAVAETTVEPTTVTAANAAPAPSGDSEEDDDEDCEPPPPPPIATLPVAPPSAAPAAADESSAALAAVVAAVGAVAVAAAVVATASSSDPAPTPAAVPPASPVDSASSDHPVSPDATVPLAVAAQPDAAAASSDSAAASPAAAAAAADDAPGIEVEEGVDIESLTRRRGVASVNKTGAPPPFKPPPPLGSMVRVSSPPPPAAAASAAAPVAVPAAAPYAVQLVNGDIPPSALGPFISKGIEAAVLQSQLHRSGKSAPANQDKKGDFARKDLYALQHGGISYTMLDYAPQTFARIRKHFGITQEAYLKSLVGAVAEAAAADTGASPAATAAAASSSSSSSFTSAVPDSPDFSCAIRGGAVGDGKSGMLFYYSRDGRYVLKTVKRDEVSFFRRILSQYADHLMKHQTHTLLPRFFSMHKIMYTTRAYTATQSSDSSSGGNGGGGGGSSATGGPGGESRTFRLLCMNNWFECVSGPPVDDLTIVHRFDLKGSTRNRRVDPALVKPGRVLLDLNFQEQGFKLHLGSVQKAAFMAQLRADADFLRRVNAMDHSLLVGIHLDDDEALERWGARAVPVDERAAQGPLLHDTQRFTKDAGLVSVWQRHRGGVRGFESAPTAAATAAAAAAGAGEGGSASASVSSSSAVSGGSAAAPAPSVPRRECYFLGIIDILQEFNTRKALESAYKCVRFNKNAISAIESRGYNQRFVNYLDSVIV